MAQKKEHVSLLLRGEDTVELFNKITKLLRRENKVEEKLDLLTKQMMAMVELLHDINLTLKAQNSGTRRIFDDTRNLAEIHHKESDSDSIFIPDVDSSHMQANLKDESAIQSIDLSGTLNALEKMRGGRKE